MDKLWLGFDVDETLGCFNYLFPIFDFLFLGIQNDYEPGQHAFQYLAQNIAQSDMDPRKHTGLFRPGLYEFFHDMINPLIDQGIIQGMVMYSNNGNPYILQFCDNVIGQWMEKENPFCYLVHRLHPIRKNINGKITSLNKTWEILSKSFRAGGCPAPLLGKTFFYDDSLQHTDLIQRLESKYVRVVPYFYPPNLLATLLPQLHDALLKSGILRKREGVNNSSLRGDDFVFDPDYIQRLYRLYKNERTQKYLKEDLEKLFKIIGETPEKLANVTWKLYQQALQVLFKEQDASIVAHRSKVTGPTMVNIKQWYEPLVSPPIEAEKANDMIERMMRNRSRFQNNTTRTANRARSTSTSLLRGTTAKKTTGRSLANMAANNNPKSMENEFKATFGLGGGRRRTLRSYRRKNASRKVKRQSRR